MKRWLIGLFLVLVLLFDFSFGLNDDGSLYWISVKSRLFFRHDYSVRDMTKDECCYTVPKTVYSAPIVIFTFDCYEKGRICATPAIYYKDDDYTANCAEQVAPHAQEWREPWCAYFSW